MKRRRLARRLGSRRKRQGVGAKRVAAARNHLRHPLRLAVHVCIRPPHLVRARLGCLLGLARRTLGLLDTRLHVLVLSIPVLDTRLHVVVLSSTLLRLVVVLRSTLLRQHRCAAA